MLQAFFLWGGLAGGVATLSFFKWIPKAAATAKVGRVIPDVMSREAGRND
jgi:hypothetical protein